MKQTQIVLLAVLISAIAASGQQGTSNGSAPADIVYGQAAQLVDVGGFRLNLYCMGSGSPTVVFDSGWGDWAPAWPKVQPQIAKWTRTCSYDRAGTGFSDPGPMPRTSVRIAERLRTALSPCRHRRPLHSQAKRMLASYTVLRWEINLRLSSILGLAGGGGLGQAIYNNVQPGFYSRLATLLLLVYVLVIASDWIADTFSRRTAGI